LSTAAYSDATRKVTSDYAIQFRRMGTLVTNPAFDNPTWRQNIANVVDSIQAIGERMRALVPPACLAEVHVAQVEAAASYDQMADLLAAGVANNDEDALAESAQLLGDGNAQVAHAAALLSATHCGGRALRREGTNRKGEHSLPGPALQNVGCRLSRVAPQVALA
jgi:hypothetical protein